MSPQKLCFLLAFRVSHAATLSGIVAGSVGVATSQDRQLVRPASTKHLMRRQSMRDGQIAQPAPREVVEKVDIATEDGKHTVLVYEGGSQPPLCEDTNYHAFMKQACAKAEKFKMLQNMQTRRSCHYNEIKGWIECDLERVCQGGELSSWKTKSVFHHATFQCKRCDDENGKILRWACCHECNRLKEQATAYWNDPDNMEPVKMNGFDLTDVQCPDCQQDELDKIAEANDKFCARDTSGAFYCHVTGQCHTGETSISTKEEEQLCVNTPCDECDDEVLRAKCCARCLSAVCNPENDDGTPLRQVCTGCIEGLLNVVETPKKEEEEEEEKKEEEKEELIEEKTPAGPDEERLSEPAIGPDEQEVGEASAPAGPDKEVLSGPPAGPDEQDKEDNTQEESLDEQVISEEDDRSGEDTPTREAE